MLAEKLDEILIELKKNTIPDRLWSQDDIAAYTGRTKKFVQNRYTGRIDFPEPVIPLRWDQNEVRDWLRSQGKNKVGRKRTN